MTRDFFLGKYCLKILPCNITDNCTLLHGSTLSPLGYIQSITVDLVDKKAKKSKYKLDALKCMIIMLQHFKMLILLTLDYSYSSLISSSSSLIRFLPSHYKIRNIFNAKF